MTAWAVAGAILLANRLINRKFFLKEHAREIALANLPQVGMATPRHYSKSKTALRGPDKKV
jgi:hypothetical protein